MQTPSQTVGPYFAYGLTPEQYRYDFDSWAQPASNADADTAPATITLSGRVLDGQGQPIPDAMIEAWLDDGQRQWFGRCGTGTDPQHRYWFQTEKLGAMPGEAPFLTLIVFMRGQLIHAFTRVYFADEAALNAQDDVFQSVPATRRHTLLAQPVSEENPHQYSFDIHMQGPDETVFFEFV